MQLDCACSREKYRASIRSDTKVTFRYASGLKIEFRLYRLYFFEQLLMGLGQTTYSTDGKNQRSPGHLPLAKFSHCKTGQTAVKDHPKQSAQWRANCKTRNFGLTGFTGKLFFLLVSVFPQPLFPLVGRDLMSLPLLT